jgi:hypothetical protein
MKYATINTDLISDSPTKIVNMRMGGNRKYARKTSIPVRISSHTQTVRNSLVVPPCVVGSLCCGPVAAGACAPILGSPYPFKFTDIKYSIGKTNIHTKSTKCQYNPLTSTSIGANFSFLNPHAMIAR